MGKATAALTFLVLILVTHADDLFKQGNVQLHAGDRVHSVRYSVTQAIPDEAIVALGNQSGLVSLHCSGLDQVFMRFNGESGAKDFQQTMAALAAADSGAFVTSNDQSCNRLQKTGVLLRRVNKAELSGFPAKLFVTLYTSPAQYGEVIKDGNISYESSAAHPLHLCIGVNVGDATSCNTAASQLPVYSHDLLTVACENCFMGFSGDVFADFHFKHFTMQGLAAGMKNLKASGAVQMTMNAASQQSFLGVDKDLWHAGSSDHPVISFHIGLIPFTISFDTKLHLVADMQCSAAATAQAGVEMEHVIGDNYLTWDPKNLWSHVHGKPTTTFTPKVSGSADFDCTGSVSLVPTMELHMSQLLSSSMTLTSKASVEVKGDKTGVQICETASYDLEISSSAQLHYSMALNLIRADASWGPVTWGVTKANSQTHCEGNATTALII